MAIRLLIPWCLTVTALWAADKGTPPGEVLVYKQTATRELRLGVVRPADWSASDSRPALVLMHGGGWYMRNLDQLTWQAHYFAQLGAVVFVADYRSTKGDGVGIGALLSDARSAMRFVRGSAARFGVDADRIMAGGASSGGHIMASTALITDPAYNDPQDDVRISCVPNLFVGFNPVMSRDEAEFSPAAHVRANSVPVVMCYGSADDNWLPTAQAYAQAAQAVGATCELQMWEGGGHGFWRTDPREKVERMLPFIYGHGMLDATVVGTAGEPVALSRLDELLPGRTWIPQDGGTVADGRFTTDAGPGLYRLLGRRDGVADRIATIRLAFMVDDAEAAVVGDPDTQTIDRAPPDWPADQPIQIGSGVTMLEQPDQRTTYVWAKAPAGTYHVECFGPFMWNAHREATVVVSGGAEAHTTSVSFGNHYPGWISLGVVHRDEPGQLSVEITGPDGSGRRRRPVPADAVRFVPVLTGR